MRTHLRIAVASAILVLLVLLALAGGYRVASTYASSCVTGFVCQGLATIINATSYIAAAPSSSDKVPYVEGGTTYNIPGPTILAGPTVANTTALRLACTAFGGSCPAGAPFFPNGVIRLTDGVAGAPPLYFKPGTGTCSVDDGASCVDSADGNSWVGQFPGGRADIRQWSPPVGGADATSQVQAAITYIGGIHGTLDLGPYIYGINGSGITCSTGPIEIDGTQHRPTTINSSVLVSGFIATATNSTLLTLTSGCSGSFLHNFGIKMASTLGTNTSGYGISALTNNTIFSDVVVINPCTGVDISGNSDVLSRVWVLAPANSGCNGILVGRQTTGGSTVDLRINDSDVTDAGVTTSNAADYGMKILDAGGLYLFGSEVIYTRSGTGILPGAHQVVAWMSAVNTILGDTTVDKGFVIDTTDSTGAVQGLQLTNAWVSTAATPTTFAYNPVPAILIQNSAGGVVRGIHFLGLRDFASMAQGIIINTGVGQVDVSIDSSRICAAGLSSPSTPYAAVEIGGGGMSGGVRGVFIHNSDLSAFCDNSSSSHQVSSLLFDDSTATDIEATNNKMMGGTNIFGIVGAPVWSGTAGVNATNIIKDNAGVDDLQFPVTIASNSFDPGSYDNITIPVSSGTVNNIGSCWPGRQIIVRTTGSVTYSITGGNIKGAAVPTPAPNVEVYAHCTGSGQWFLK